MIVSPYLQELEMLSKSSRIAYVMLKTGGDIKAEEVLGIDTGFITIARDDETIPIPEENIDWVCFWEKDK